MSLVAAIKRQYQEEFVSRFVAMRFNWRHLARAAAAGTRGPSIDVFANVEMNTWHRDLRQIFVLILLLVIVLEGFRSKPDYD